MIWLLPNSSQRHRLPNEIPQNPELLDLCFSTFISLFNDCMKRHASQTKASRKKRKLISNQGYQKVYLFLSGKNKTE